jgi:hypothetical protein
MQTPSQTDAADSIQDREERVLRAIQHLREARDILDAVGSPRALDRVRAALRSATGAARHASRRDFRASLGLPALRPGRRRKA